MAQLCSDPHAQFAEHPLAPAVVKASGSNYLAQSLHEGASALAIPTSRGNVCLHRWSAGGLPSDALSVIDAAPEASNSVTTAAHWPANVWASQCAASAASSCSSNAAAAAA